MFMGILKACMSVFHVSAWCMQKPEKGMESAGIGVIGSCKPQS